MPGFQKVSDQDVELGNLTTESNESIGYVAKVEFPKNRGCEICNIAELPYRAKHCHDCRRCVRKYDHHCFWVGGCVGELNHGKFLAFVVLQTIVF